MLAAKEVVVLFILISALTNAFLIGKFSKVELFLYCTLVGILFISFVHGQFVLMSVRQLLLLPLLFLTGMVLVLHFQESFERIAKRSLLFFWIVLFTTYIEWIVGGGDEWLLRLVNVPEFMIMKEFELWAFGPFGLPGNYYTYDFYSFTGETYRRAVSILLEPTLLGQFLVLPVLYFFLQKKYFLSLMFFFGVVLALSKGGVFTLAMALIYYLYFFVLPKGVRFVVLIGVLLSFILIYELSQALGIQSIINHFAGITHNFLYILTSPLGLGVGYSGNFSSLAERAGTIDNDVLAGESFVGVVIGQFGVIGLMLYMMFFRYVWQLEAYSVMEKSVKLVALGTLTSAIVSESAISFIGGGILFILLGALAAQQRMMKKVKNVKK